MAARRLPEALVRPDDQPGRVAGVGPRAAAGRCARARRERVRGRAAGNGRVPARSCSSRCLPASGSTGCARRPILIVTDLGRGLFLASIPVAYLLDALTIWQLYVVGFLVGICTVFFDVAYQSYLPSLVRKDQLVEGNSLLEVSRNAAQIGGPGMAGLLVGAITAPYAILVDAVSFLGSAALLVGDSHRGRATAGDREAEHVARAARRARVPRAASLLAADLDHDRELELLLDDVRVDHHRLRRARARPVAGGDRVDVLARAASEGFSARSSAGPCRRDSASGRRSSPRRSCSAPP